jgi:hypothetical protein
VWRNRKEGSVSSRGRREISGLLSSTLIPASCIETRDRSIWYQEATIKTQHESCCNHGTYHFLFHPPGSQSSFFSISWPITMIG